MIIPIDQVTSDREVSLRDRRIMVDVLKRQGQIEPLQVKELRPGLYLTHDEDTHGAAIAAAARVLGWTTLLICVTRRYQP